MTDTTAQNTPVATLPLTQEHLEVEQMQKVEEILKRGAPVTNFDIQRELFGGTLNKESALAIKRFLLQLKKEDKVVAEGQKRGRKYFWKV
jgi:hypothetical protein